MYQTMISGVRDRRCIDEHGRTLERIGNINVNEGDVVWTDGRVIYGNEYFNAAEVPLLSSASVMAIPLNAVWHDSLFVCRSGRKIERYAGAKDDLPFANNETSYCLGRSWWECTDMDIGRDGRPWAVDARGAEYRKRTPIEFYARYRGENEKTSFNVLAEYFYNWDEYAVINHFFEKTTYTSAAHPERNYDSDNHEDKSRKANDPVRGITPLMVYGDETVKDTPVLVTHGKETVDTLSLGEYAEGAKAYWSGLMGKFGGSRKWKESIENCSCSVYDARIDEKGNYSIVVSAKAGGYCFKDVRISILSVVRNKKTVTTDSESNIFTMQGETYSWDTKRIEKVDDETVVGTEPSLRTIPGSLSCEVRYLVNRDGRKEIYRSYSYTSPLKYGTLETSSGGTYGRLTNNSQSFGQDFPPATNIFSVWEGTASLAGFGTFMGGYTARELPPVTFPPKTYTPYTVSETGEEEMEYEMPIQDGYVCRNGDYTGVYKDGNPVVSVDFEVGGIAVLDAKKKEYLLLGKTDGQIALFRNGSVSYPEMPAYRSSARFAITLTNTRLRWMKALPKLRS